MSFYPEGILSAPSLADLRNAPTGPAVRVQLIYQTTPGDGRGGFYQWDGASALAEDMVFLNVVASNLSATGRWVRVFQRAKSLPQGVLTFNGPIKTLYAGGVTDANGTVTWNLTDDNTATGNALFTELWDNRSYCRDAATGPATAVQFFIKTAPPANLKTTTHGYFKANAVTVTVGLLLTPVASVGAGVNVQGIFVGI